MKEFLQSGILNHFNKQIDFAKYSWSLVHEKAHSNDFVTHQESPGLERKFYCWEMIIKYTLLVVRFLDVTNNVHQVAFKLHGYERAN